MAWDLKHVTEFLFASVDLAIEPPAQHWLVAKRNDLMGEDGNKNYANQDIPIVASTVSSYPYKAKW